MRELFAADDRRFERFSLSAAGLTLDALNEATLKAPMAPLRKGGKTGLHSEGLGRILSDLQFLQRAYPGATW